jgi:hypothetical protein
MLDENITRYEALQREFEKYGISYPAHHKWRIKRLYEIDWDFENSTYHSEYDAAIYEWKLAVEELEEAKYWEAQAKYWEAQTSPAPPGPQPQLQLPPGEIYSARPADSLVWYRDWALNLLETTLSTPGAPQQGRLSLEDYAFGYVKSNLEPKQGEFVEAARDDGYLEDRQQRA